MNRIMNRLSISKRMKTITQTMKSFSKKMDKKMDNGTRQIGKEFKTTINFSQREIKLRLKKRNLC